MPAPVVSIDVSLNARPASSKKRGVWCLLEIAIAAPGARPAPYGVLLAGDEYAQSLSRVEDIEEEFSGHEFSEPEADLLAALEADLAMKARERGGAALLAGLEDSLSNFLRVSDRTEISYTGSAQAEADRLFARHVDSRVRPFVTHLPLYGLRAAATKFGENMDSAQEGWVRVRRTRLGDDMFVARVVGRSMEPLIPDGSFCIFRAIAAGTRQSKRVLVEKFGETDFSARYTVKRYTSSKQQTEEGWKHDRIRLEPLNPEFEAFDLDGADFDSQFRVIGEFIEALPV